MPERTSFAVRYAIPGYTFISMALLVTYAEFQDVFLHTQNMELVGVLLAFFTLLSGGAIGFLVSQPYYFFNNRFLHRRALRRAREFLERKYNLAKDPHRQIVFLDYVYHLSGKEKIAYAQRRFDLKHTLASTFSAIFLGLSFGLVIRAAYSGADITLGKVVESLNVSTTDSLVIPIVVFLSLFLYMGFRHISEEHAMMVHISLRTVWRSGIFPYSKARAIFTEDYFNEKWR
ncbi:MAG: hypothetical protein PVF15_11165 [Candidatus Bathyarchaeota archaeon]|jgi:hypothetical protein